MGTNRALAGWVTGCIYSCGLWKWFRAMVNYLFCGCSLAEVCGYGIWLHIGSCLAAICYCRLVAIVQPQRTWEELLVDGVLLEAAAQKGPLWSEWPFTLNPLPREVGSQLCLDIRAVFSVGVAVIWVREGRRRDLCQEGQREGLGTVPDSCPHLHLWTPFSPCSSTLP